MLVVSVLLGTVPLLGIGLMFYQDPQLTVDNLFLSLMLLAISGIFFLNAAFELKGKLAQRKKAKEPRPEAAKAVAAAANSPAAQLAKQVGIVREVQFFEAPVGTPNKSIVTLQLNGANSSRLFAFEGDLRNALPVGKKVEIRFRDRGGALDLQEVNYV
jgi:hypothetical protein